MAADEDEAKSRGLMLTAYLAGLAAWFLPLGVQMVLFPWLVAVVLHMDALAVGIAQAALMVPGLFFLPLGGLMADRGNPRRLLRWYHLFYATPPLILSFVLWLGGLSYPLLLVYGVALGTISALAIPTRDALLPRIVRKGELPRAVALVTALQFAGQLVGIACASLADQLGAPPLLLLISTLLLLGAFSLRWVPDPAPHPPRKHQSFWRGIGEGLSEAKKSAQLWPVLLLNLGVGLFYTGPFVAVIPLAVRDYYGGRAAELAYVSFAFWAGTIIASVSMTMLAKRLVLRGRVVVTAVCSGVLVLAGLSTLPSFEVFIGLGFAWGVGHGIALTQARTIVQVIAPPTHRARLLALFQLGMGGGGPIGSVIAGVLSSLWTLQTAMLLPALAMGVLVSLLLLFSTIWTMRTVAD